jgi:transglutaminase-like putative cysteine protease
MKIRIGFDFIYEFVARTPMVLMLNVHPSRAIDLIKPDQLRITPALPVTRYQDAFGNTCTRLVAPGGQVEISTDALVHDSGQPDVVEPAARQYEIAELPHDTLAFLLASRYCETERLMNEAWSRFGKTPLGWPRVQAICDFVHSHVRFGYQHARATKTAAEVVIERRGVCRDFAHLAVAFLRALNVPARYCFGYLPDIDVAPLPEPMDFAAWLEAYIGDRWFVLDPRNNQRRTGRVVIGRGRDALDTAMLTSYGSAPLTAMRVAAEPVTSEPWSSASPPVLGAFEAEAS